MCFFRRKSKRVAAAKSVAASAAAATASDSSALESASTTSTTRESATEANGATAATSEKASVVAVLTGQSEPDLVVGQGVSEPDDSASGTQGIPGAQDAAQPSVDATEPADEATRAGQAMGAGADARSGESVDQPAGERDQSAAGRSPDDGPSDSEALGARAPAADAPDARTPDAGTPDADVSDAVTATSRAGDTNAGDPDVTAAPAGDLALAKDAELVPSSEDMAPPLPEVVDDGPRDQVWGQDRPEAEGENVAALSQLIESVTTPTAVDGEPSADAPEAEAAASGAGASDASEGSIEETTGSALDDDPDRMEELPTDRPVPADAIRRASEALDAAVNAAPAVIGSGSRGTEDEAVALVDAELTHFDSETGLESEPEETTSDYSVRVTDPIPVQSLSAPGVSRETSGPAQMPNGTQQPTGGPHGGDDERRSALIATVPAVDDTTPVAAELAMDARRRIELQGRRFPRPPKTRIITVANQKGGVGKTTTTVNVAAGLAQSGLNVLVIDNDPQGNASTALGIEHRAGTPSVYEVLVEGESLASTVQQCPDVPNLWGVPATIDLSGSEIELVSLVSRETRLRKAIDKYLADRIAAGEERIDYVLIDCPPSLGLLTVNAFVAGREVFIPIQCEYYALEGLSQLLKTIDLIRSHLNPELRVSSILLTMYDGRTNLAQQVAGEVRSHFPAETFKTTIPRSVRISEAPSYGQTVMTYDATSTGALAYLQASRELAERGQGGSSPRRAMQAEPVGAQD